MTTVWRCWQRITWRRGRTQWTSCTSSPMISWLLRCPPSSVTRPPATCLPGERGMRLSTLPRLRKDFVRACDTPRSLCRGLLGSRRAMCGVSARTTAPRAQILHLPGQATAWEHVTMVTETRGYGVAATRVTRACGPTVRATVYPAVLAAYGTRLRGIPLNTGFHGN